MSESYTSPDNITTQLYQEAESYSIRKQVAKQPTKQKHSSGSLSTPYKTFFHTSQHLMLMIRRDVRVNGRSQKWTFSSCPWSHMDQQTRKQGTCCSAHGELSQFSQTQAPGKGVFSDSMRSPSDLCFLRIGCADRQKSHKWFLFFSS